MDNEIKKLTVEEWLKEAKELGYYITQQRVVVREVYKGWKAVAVNVVFLLIIGSVFTALASDWRCHIRPIFFVGEQK